MKKAKMMAAIAAAVTALNALCIPAAAKDIQDMTPEERTEAFVKSVRARYGPFYTLGTDVSAYEPGDITMDGKVDMTDCIAVAKAFNHIVLNEEVAYLTEDQISLGNVVKYQRPYQTYPIALDDACAILRYLNFWDILGEPCTMEEAAAHFER